MIQTPHCKTMMPAFETRVEVLPSFIKKRRDESDLFWNALDQEQKLAMSRKEDVKKCRVVTARIRIQDITKIDLPSHSFTCDFALEVLAAYSLGGAHRL